MTTWQDSMSEGINRREKWKKVGYGTMYFIPTYGFFNNAVSNLDYTV
jgi:hypothetical protein